MNHSIVTADAITHLKIATLALIAGIIVVAVGLSARGNNPETVTARAEGNGPVVKAGQPAQFTTRSGIEIR